MVTQTRRRRSPPFQRRWLRVYWTSVGLLCLFAFWGTLAYQAGGATFPLASLVSLHLGCGALILGATLATRLSRTGVSDMWFVKGTTTTRATAVGWLFVLISIPGGVILVTLLGLDVDDVTLTTAGVLGSLGAVAIVAVLGPGYTEYREALDTVRPSLPYTTPEPDARQAHPR